MPPRKRKADAPAEDGDDGILPTPSKKSKKEMAAEARAKAKAWRDARHSKTPTPSTASSKKSSATTSSSPTFSAGKSPPSKKISTSTSVTTSSATKRRRTTSTRKSTGGLVGSSSRTSSPTTSGNEAPVRKSRRSIAASTKFEFKEPLREEEGEEEESSADDVEMTKKDAAVQSGGNKKSSKKSPVKYEFGKDYLTMNDSEEEEEDEEEEEEEEIVEKKKSSTSASSAALAKSKKSQGRAAIQALREQREKKGLRVSGHHHPLSPQLAASGGMKSPPETNYPNPPTAAVAAASAAAGSSATLKSPDPPASSSATKPPPAATSSSTKKPKSSSSTKKKPPAAVASLFNTSKNKQTKSTAHRPYKQTFDPSKPFPSTGYKLPTAAYCGCGPSLGSATTSVRGQSQLGLNGLGGGGGDVCMVNTTNNNGSDDVVGRGSFNVKDTFSSQQPVDPPYKSWYGQEQAGGDEMKMAAAKPSPPGKNGGTNGADSAATEPTSTTATAAPPREEPVQNAGILQAILRAKALVSSAASGNQKRRTEMGIKGTIVPHNIPQTAVNPPSGQQPIDPPPSNAIDSAPVSYAATLQKFRDTGANNNEAATSTEMKSAAAAAVKTEDNDKTETTDAGENTSEAGGENEESNGIINKEEDESEVVAEEQNKRPGIIKSSCLVIGKFIMVVQLSFGLFYVASLAASNINWDELKNIIPENTGSAAEQEEEVSPSCFIDSRYWDGGVIPKGWRIHDGREDHHEEEEEGKPIDDLCAGRYKQCPLYGRCYRGVLQDCLDEDGLFDGIKRHVPNEKNDGCIVSSQATELAEIVQQVLEDMTVAQTCGTADKTWGDENMLKEEPFPLFYPEMVAKRMNVYDSYTHLILDTDEGRRIDVTVDFLVWLSPAFDHTKIEFGPTTWLTMGLSQGVPPNSLHLPLDCTMKLLFWELLEGFFEWTVLFMLFSFENGWWLVSTYPLYCLGAAVFLRGCIALQKRRKHKAKVRELYDTIYEAVYDRLAECEDHEGFAALHLRDQISRDIYPTNKREQQFVIDHVWPRMVREIWSDNRVRKFRRVAMGKELEHWDFAVQAKRIRRERRSLGTPGRGNTLNALVNVKKEEDETPAKRDP